MKTMLAMAIALALATGGAYAASGDETCFKFEDVDRDGDGAVTQEEAMATMEEHHARMDEDDDGKVEQDEFNAYLSDLESSQAGQ